MSTLFFKANLVLILTLAYLGISTDCSKCLLRSLYSVWILTPPSSAWALELVHFMTVGLVEFYTFYVYISIQISIQTKISKGLLVLISGALSLLSGGLSGILPCKLQCFSLPEHQSWALQPGEMAVFLYGFLHCVPSSKNCL